MFIFACPIIDKRQCWLFALRANIRIGPQISVLALKYPYWPSNIRIDPQTFVFASEFNFNFRKYVKVHGKIKSYINQIITLQNIGIKFE